MTNPLSLNKARDLRKRAENEAQLLKNRVALLKYEQEKIDRAIERRAEKMEKLNTQKNEIKRDKERLDLERRLKIENEREIRRSIQSRRDESRCVSRASRNRALLTKSENAMNRRLERAQNETQYRLELESQQNQKKKIVHQIKNEEQKALNNLNQLKQIQSENNARHYEERIAEEAMARLTMEQNVRDLENEEARLINLLHRKQQTIQKYESDIASAALENQEMIRKLRGITM